MVVCVQLANAANRGSLPQDRSLNIFRLPHNSQAVPQKLQPSRSERSCWNKLSIPSMRRAGRAGRAREEELVAARQVRRAPVVLDEVAHHGALGVPEHQPRARRLVDAEQLQLRAQLPVVPARNTGA